MTPRPNPPEGLGSARQGHVARMKRHTVFLGGGLASAAAIGSYREAGGDDRLALVTSEVFLPYHRPPLSKGYMRGESGRDDALVEPAQHYVDADVELRVGTVVESVDLDGRTLRLADADGEMSFDRLVVATGATPRPLRVPGAESPGVYTLRALADADAIRAAAAEVETAVVVGGSFIGTEVAASLSQLGLEVALVHQGPALHERLAVPELSDHLRELFSARGVEVLLEHEVTAIEGKDRVERVIAGDRRLEAGLVVVGVGVEPATGVLAEERLELGDGIVVDERFSASAPDVFAIGDVARFPDAAAGRTRRIEHWDNAEAQGEHLGRLLAGATEEPFDHVAMFFSDVFDLSFELYGDLHEHDEVIVRGNVEDHHALAMFLRDDVLTAGLAIGQDKETTAELNHLIAQRARVRSSQRSALETTNATLSQALATEASH